MRAAVVESPLGKGRSLLFGINPNWRGATIGTHPLVWNALLAGAELEEVLDLRAMTELGVPGGKGLPGGG